MSASFSLGHVTPARRALGRIRAMRKDWKYALPAAALALAAFLLSPLIITRGTITKGPYLVHPGKTTMTIMWETDKPGEANLRFDIGEALDQKLTVAAPARIEYSDGWWGDAPRLKAYLYRAALKNLRPGTKYSYQVEREGLKSRLHHFTTFPEKADRFTFIVYGDSRGNPLVHGMLASQFEKHSPTFIINTGDLVDVGGFYEEWGPQYFEPLTGVIDHIPLLPALGNHDVELDGGNNFARLFDWKKREPLVFSFDYGNAHFVALDYQYGTSKKMMEWFEKDMKKTKANWKFVYNHFPCYNLGGHGTAWGRATFVPLFKKHKVDIVFAGDSHIYERFYPLKPAQDDPFQWPVTYIVTAGGGAFLYQSVKHPLLAASGSLYHYMVITIEGNTLSATTYTATGEKFDQFTITKKGGKYTDDYLELAKPEQELIKATERFYPRELYLP